MTTKLLNENERTRCEIWTRVMGYHRPISEFNIGKQSEYTERVTFEESNAANLVCETVAA